MEKLVGKLIKLIMIADENICEDSNKDKPWIVRFAELQAEEVRKISIEFKSWYMQQPKEKINLSEVPDGTSIEDFLKQWDNLQFDKFISEYYD